MPPGGAILDATDFPPHENSGKAFDLDDCTVALFTAVVALAMYLRTLAPTVTGEDSGELIAAAYTMGIPHPTGYPLWCILGGFFINILPIDGIAWRVNFMSAFFSAATVAVTVLLIVKLTRNRWAAVAGALALAFSFEFWEQSVIAEVYSLNAFLTALCILIVVRWQETGRPRLLILFGFCFGLGLCNHNIILLAGPVFALYILAVGGLSGESIKTYFRALAAMALALLLHLYLPLRSMANPPMDWGNPETWSDFRDVVTRAQYTFIVTESPRSLSKFLAQLWVYLGIYSSQFTPGIGWLAPVGVIALFRRRPGPTLLLCLLFIVFSIGCIVIPNFGFDRMSIWINTTYWIPAYAIAALFIGVAIAWVTTLPSSVVLQRVLAVILTVTAAALPLAANYEDNDKSDNYLAHDFAKNILDTMAPGAIYFGDSDHALFPVMYLQIVEGIRPDVTVANPYGYPIQKAYAAMPEEVEATFAKRPTEKDERVIFEWLVNYSGRPVYTTAKRQGDGLVATNTGLLYRYTAKHLAITQPPTWSVYRWHSLDEADVRGDWSGGLILFDYHFARGRCLLDEAKRKDAIKEFELAAHFAREEKEGLNNLGSAAAEYGLFDQAIEYLSAACNLDPTFIMARRNLGKAYMQAGRFKEAVEQFDRVLQDAPNDPAALALKRRCEQQLAR